MNNFKTLQNLEFEPFYLTKITLPPSAAYWAAQVIHAEKTLVELLQASLTSSKVLSNFGDGLTNVVGW